MNLKEAFRFQNKLQSLMDEALCILSADANITRVETTLLRSRVMPEAEDETVVSQPQTELSDRITDIARFMLYLLGEKEKLSAGIRKAKAALDIDMDSEVSLNSQRRQLAHTLQRMNDLRSSEQTVSGGGTGYRFNTDGNQVSYRCDIKRVTTINYDRNAVRRMLSRLNSASDEISARLDLCMVTSKVEYMPPFDVNDSFTDAFEYFVNSPAA